MHDCVNVVTVIICVRLFPKHETTSMHQVVLLQFQDLENVLSSGPVEKAKRAIIESFATIGRPTKHSISSFCQRAWNFMTQLAHCGKDMLESKGHA